MQGSKKSLGLKPLGSFDKSDFEVPKKLINDASDVPRFLASKAYADIVSFILQLNASMFPRSVRPEDALHGVTNSPIIDGLQSLLSELEKLISDAPPDPGPRRFGNISFRKWISLMQSQASDLLNKHLPAIVVEHRLWEDANNSPKIELKAYLVGSFGSGERLDYGTGHELSFLAFLGCIWKLGGFASQPDEGTERAIVLGVVKPYLDLVRRLILTYNLEPAGSHGVWGLDDHSFIPYIFGSAQLGPNISSPEDIPPEGSLPGAPDPGDVIKPEVVDRYRNENLYFGAIGFIYDVKKGPFWEHSPMLYDISGVKAGWAKINKGMIKMYVGEVLSKFPVVQHFYFGGMFKWERDSAATTGQLAFPASPQDSQTSSKHSGAVKGDEFVGTAAPWASKHASESATRASTSKDSGGARGLSISTRTSDLRRPQPHSQPASQSVAAAVHGSSKSSLPKTAKEANPTMASTRAPWAKDP